MITGTFHTSESTMSTTGDVVKFFDDLFDSVNGYPGGLKVGKLRRAVKLNSMHKNFWAEAVKKLKTIKFIDQSSKLAIQAGKPRFVRVPSLEGWVTTIESFQRIAKILFNQYQIKYFYPRYINQDPLENFFGRLRAMNYRNVNPDTTTFKYSFKSLMLSNILSPHSKFSNCEEDEGETILDYSFLFQKSDEEDKENVSPQININIQSLQSSQNEVVGLADKIGMEKVKVQCSAYTAGFLCRKISKAIKCRACTKTFTTKEINENHFFIQCREYKTLKKNNLTYPKNDLIEIYKSGAQTIHDYLNKYACKKNVITDLKIY